MVIRVGRSDRVVCRPARSDRLRHVSVCLSHIRQGDRDMS